jgi:hypothetical protein
MQGNERAQCSFTVLYAAHTTVLRSMFLSSLPTPLKGNVRVLSPIHVYQLRLRSLSCCISYSFRDLNISHSAGISRVCIRLFELEYPQSPRY